MPFTLRTASSQPKPNKLIGSQEVNFQVCLLYTSDAADERSSVDLGGRRIIKKKKQFTTQWSAWRKTHKTASMSKQQQIDEESREGDSIW